MKTISIKQPWASLIVEGIKDIENRTWPTKFRGRVLIHASGKPVGRMKYNSCFSHVVNKSQFEHLKSISFSKWFMEGYSFGEIIGSVEIVDCVINHESIWADKGLAFVGYHKDGRVKRKPTYNWVLANPIKFPEPIPAKGKLSFWDYPNILAEREEKGGALFCHCELPVKEINQVTGDYRFGYYCRYCGGKWYK